MEIEKIIQIATSEKELFALSSDGKIYAKSLVTNDNWVELEGPIGNSISEDETKPKKI